MIPDLDHEALGLDPDMLDEDAAEALKALADAQLASGGQGVAGSGSGRSEQLEHTDIVLSGVE